MLALGILAIVLAWLAQPPASVANEIAVSIANYAYRPPLITITVGDSVTWTQHDVEQHTVTACTATTCPSVSGLAFDSRLLTQGQAFRLTFASPGIYPYYCTVYTYAIMHGTIIVTPLPPGPASAAPLTLAPPVPASPASAAPQTLAPPVLASPLTAAPQASVSTPPEPSPNPTVAKASQAASDSASSAFLNASGATAAAGSPVTGPPSGSATSGIAAILVALIALGLSAMMILVGLKNQGGETSRD